MRRRWGWGLRWRNTAYMLFLSRYDQRPARPLRLYLRGWWRLYARKVPCHD